MKHRFVALLLVMLLGMSMVASFASADDPPTPIDGDAGYGVDPDILIFQEAAPTDCPFSQGCVTVRADSMYYQSYWAGCSNSWQWSSYDTANNPGYIGCKPMRTCEFQGFYYFKTWAPWRLSSSQNAAQGTVKCLDGVGLTNSTEYANFKLYTPFDDVSIIVKWHQVSIFNNNGWWNAYPPTGLLGKATTTGAQVTCPRHSGTGIKHQTRHTFHYYERLEYENSGSGKYRTDVNGKVIIFVAQVYAPQTGVTLVPCS